MTERALPAIGVGVRSRPTAGAGTRPVVAPLAADATRVVAARREAILSTPVRAGMLIGASAAVYAVTLAGVSTLQARSDAATIAARAPYVEAVAEARAANDALAARLLATDAGVRSLVAEYETTGADLADFQARIDSLAALVAEVEGSAAALPTRLKLPTVTMRGAVGGGGGGGGSSAPSTSGKSGASGG
jgi:hypothetical protein